jgi:hypothetical protein
VTDTADQETRPDPGLSGRQRITRQRLETARKQRPPLPERILLRLCDSGEIDGLWIGYWGKDTEFRRVEEALGLIKTYDRVRYDRLIRDLKRIWVVPLVGALGTFTPAIASCKLDPRFVLAEPPEMIAAVIVHEATHARLRRWGIGYAEDERARVEAACARQELAFAAKLPNGEQVREQAVRYLESCEIPRNWSNAALSERHRSAAAQTLGYVGFPGWLARTVLALFAAWRGVTRFVRGLVVRLRF